MGNQRLDHLLSKETAVLRGPEPASQDCKVKSGGLRAARQCTNISVPFLLQRYVGLVAQLVRARP